MNNRKENFYIFLDIDGVLWDWSWIFKRIKLGRINSQLLVLNEFNPKSIMALNYLIKTLNYNYNVDLVISSTRRFNMKQTVNILYKNGLIFDNEIHNTGKLFSKQKRGSEVAEYLKNKPNNENFVAIDNDYFNFKETLDMNKFIKTDVYREGLTLNHINNFFNNNPEYLKNNKIEKTK